jgi:hypothetical protein
VSLLVKQLQWQQEHQDAIGIHQQISIPLLHEHHRHSQPKDVLPKRLHRQADCQPKVLMLYSKVCGLHTSLWFKTIFQMTKWIVQQEFSQVVTQSQFQQLRRVLNSKKEDRFMFTIFDIVIVLQSFSQTEIFPNYFLKKKTLLNAHLELTKQT